MAQRGSISLPPLSPRSALPATRMAAWKLPPLSQGLAPRGAATTSFQDVEVSASPSANLDPGYVAARPHGPLGGRPGQEWALSSITSSISHADARRLASGGGDEGGGVFSIPGSANQENPYTAANWHAQVCPPSLERAREVLTRPVTWWATFLGHFCPRLFGTAGPCAFLAVSCPTRCS